MPEAVRETEVAIIGAGFGGIGMAAKLLRSGRRDFVIFERGGDVGGTWRDNTYPGCGCDVPSHVYSFSFAPNPDWSATYAGQPEIQAYLQKVAAEEGVTERVRFNCAVEEASWNEDEERWRIETSDGEFSARILVSAAGPLNDSTIPDVPGLDKFDGTVFHSAEWNHEYDLTGKRVAVIGTGASSIQLVPEVQPKVGSLHLFQRTPPWIVPRTARPLTGFEHHLYRRFPAAQRAMRTIVSLAREAMAVPMVQSRLSVLTRRLAESHLRRQVPDPVLRQTLTPDYAPGCKRILISNEYYPALQEANVELVDGGLVEVRKGSVVGADGREREVDAIVFGTGFNVTEPPIAALLRGRDGVRLSDAWAETGMQAHRGTTVAGFPNLFMLLGPNTGLGHNSVMLMAEAQIDYALGAIDHMERTGVTSLEPLASEQSRWNDLVQKRTRGTVWVDGGCASWYLDRHGRNTTVWPSFSLAFRRELRSFRPAEYATASAPRAAATAVAA